MSFWGSEWGSEWGCRGFALLDICECWLWWQFVDKPNMRALVCEVMVKLYSDLDDKLRTVVERRGLDGAVGGELDSWGAMLDEKRNGMADELYRIAIKAKARSILSNGQLRDLDDVAHLIAPERSITFQEAYPACVLMFFSAATTEDERMLLFRLMLEVVGRGICIGFVEVDPNGVFEFSYTTDNVVFDPVGRHWGHTDGDIDPDETAGMAYRI